MMRKCLSIFLVFSSLFTLNIKLSAAQVPEGWLTNYDYANKIAKKQNKPLIILFTGSDWCHYCIKLRQEIIDKKEFQNWSKNKAVFFYCDFPQNTRQSPQQKNFNRKLAKKYFINGFPTTIVLAPSGKIVGKIDGYSPNFLNDLQTLLKKWNDSQNQ